jgi:2-hydroxycyclohexanecarboxyl-CoA dehydrogenase
MHNPEGQHAGSNVRVWRDQAEAVERVVERFEAECGPVQALVNNAGWDLAVSFLDSEPTQWRQVIDINLYNLYNVYGPLNVGKCVLSRMVERADGRIVSIASDDAAFITGQTISVSGGLTMHG